MDCLSYSLYSTTFDHRLLATNLAESQNPICFLPRPQPADALKKLIAIASLKKPLPKGAPLVAPSALLVR